MDLNVILIWTVAVSCGLMIFQLLSQRSGRVRLSVPVLVLLLLAATAWLRPSRAGYVAGVAWLVFMVLPGAGMSLLGTLLARKSFRSARLVATLLGWIHPFDGARRLPKLIQAIGWLQNGQADRALPVLEKLQSAPGSVGRMALVVRTRQTGDWQSLLDWAYADPHRLNQPDPVLLDAYFQALGELGRRHDLLREYDRLIVRRPPFLPPQPLAMIHCKIAAFCGDELLVLQLCSSVLGSFPPELKRFWQATALQTSGRHQAAEAEFFELAESDNSAVAVASLRRLQSPLSSITDEPLDEFGRQTLAAVQRAAGPSIAAVSLYRRRRCWVTWSLATVLLLIFLAELPGGSEDSDNLYRMGALVIPVELNGAQWWRVITAAFLHYGPLHFALNTLGLIVLGRQLERLWGPGQLLITYLLAAIGSIAFAPFLMTIDDLDEWTILIGASGGVMGLIGGLLVQAAINLWKGRSRAMAREFGILVFVVVVQMIFDRNTPNVSSEAHLLGLVIGATCGLIWNAIWSLRRVR
ncbi:rhomboid family intramembrane serine protease [Planctomicrobium piriforme]|uniref:Membrane associated serine protease, rhomboid family n=1 Tax=Planctomicrobium piriforme TaxID=1576369 RepID=A0A1I3IA10_9PLAN|nr:rhomboid family intramembrane serine protease [Planctomicrobium piriforme]SFI44766.1 Membrane associated serine protease, rhomboid family [Planctomicrobium piriforme]